MSETRASYHTIIIPPDTDFGTDARIGGEHTPCIRVKDPCRAW